MCAGGTATANSDPREGVRSGQLQHDVKEYVRGHVSGDVVGVKLENEYGALITASATFGHLE